MEQAVTTLPAVREVAAYPVAPRQHTIQEITTIGQAYAASGMFPDIKQQGQAIVKIMAGQEMGVAPFASMTGIHIIQGKAVIGANLMADRVKASGKYDYRVLKLDDTGCELEFYQNGKPVGKSAFTEKDAKAAGLFGKDNWKKYARNMYFARALSNGQRWYAPDVFNGATVYTPDEMGAKVDEDGNAVIEAQVTDYPTPTAKPPQTASNAVKTGAEKERAERWAAFQKWGKETKAATGKESKWIKDQWDMACGEAGYATDPRDMTGEQFADVLPRAAEYVRSAINAENLSAAPAGDEIPFDTTSENAD